MCGIAGISLSPNDTKLNVRTVSADLLRGIASRGPDATGASWYDHSEDAVKLTKIAVNTAKFLDAREEVFPETTPVMILHTRMATTGDKSNRGNNHPIHHGNIIGVHNGVLWGHEDMFKEMGRQPLADVDSEAIFALLNGGVKPDKVLNKVAGDAAIAWIDLHDPEVLHLARIVDRPLYVAQTTEGSLLFASTKAAVETAAKNAGLTIEFAKDIEEAKYLRVVGGVITDYLDIPGVQRNAAWSQKYAYTSGGTAARHTWWGSEDEEFCTPAAKPAGTVTTITQDGRTVTGQKPELRDAETKETLAVATTTWFSGKNMPELRGMVKNGSKTALAELQLRGMDARGERVRILSNEELVELNASMKNGHIWAARQLAYRGLNAKGDPSTDKDLITDTDELVTLAAGGSVLAVEALAANGLDRAGRPLVLATPVS